MIFFHLHLSHQDKVSFCWVPDEQYFAITFFCNNVAQQFCNNLNWDMEGNAIRKYIINWDMEGNALRKNFALRK